MSNRIKESKSFSSEQWKLNSKLLRDESFTRAGMQDIKKISVDSVDKIGEQWKNFNIQIKMKGLERSSLLLFGAKKQEKVLKKTIEKLTALQCKKPGVYAEDLYNIKQKLELYYKARYHRVQVKARADAIALDECPAKRALILEKRQAQCSSFEAYDSS